MQSRGRILPQAPHVTLRPLKRNAGLAGIMLIALLTTKKIYMQAEQKEFIHKSWDLL